MKQDEIIHQLAEQGYEFLVIPITGDDQLLLRKARAIAREYIPAHSLAALGSGATHSCRTLRWLVENDYHSPGLVREIREVGNYEDERTQTEIWDALKSILKLTSRQQRKIVFILDLQGSVAFALHVAKALGHEMLLKMRGEVAVQIDKTGISWLAVI